MQSMYHSLNRDSNVPGEMLTDASQLQAIRDSISLDMKTATNDLYNYVRLKQCAQQNETDLLGGLVKIKIYQDDQDDTSPVVEEYYYKIDDISNARARYPISAINLCDHEPYPHVEYISDYENMVYCKDTESINQNIHNKCSGCTCPGVCGDKCSCCLLQENKHCSYDANGLLKPGEGVDDKIFECNMNCSCDQFCNNRVVQRGSPELVLQVFKTMNKGWGVRTLVDIKAHQFIQEYLGEVILEAEAESRGDIYDERGCSYLFDMAGGDNKYTIDAYRYGNLTRFFNHSCGPNMLSVRVGVDVQDDYVSRIAFFAKRDISAMEELNFDYKYQIYKKMKCYCGAATCRQWVQ
ncbi:[histone H3]-lysine9 N-trimethyltransferase SUV39H [Acrasis kona]|uniref:[histone H3]-lysine9 N-trimethyltransferase SUV39H n=1 Tax=Acrasis kona TaxID=1008807 RepID=A0AAW2YJ76_9EUKA